MQVIISYFGWDEVSYEEIWFKKRIEFYSMIQHFFSFIFRCTLSSCLFTKYTCTLANFFKECKKERKIKKERGRKRDRLKERVMERKREKERER